HSAGILRFQKFRRRDSALKIAGHDWHPSPSRRPAQKATVPPIGLIATSSPGEANPTAPIHSLNAEDLTAGRPVLGIPELRVQRDNYDGRLPTIKLAKSGSRRVAR